MGTEKNFLTFDWETYYDNYKEIINTDLEIDIKNRDVSWHHWKQFGERKNFNYFELNNSAKIPSINPLDSNDEYILFDHETYIMLYSDLATSVKTKEEAWNHWIKYGKNEGRIWNISENWKSYADGYPDLQRSIKNDKDAWEHWVNYGKNEGRKWKISESDVNKKTKNVKETDEIAFIKKIENMRETENLGESEDLLWETIEKLENVSGKKEIEWGVLESVNDYDTFDWKNYIKNYPDLCHFTHKVDAWKHWIKFGKEEGRTYGKIDVSKNSLKSPEEKINEELANFDWEKYVDKYGDLKTINSKDAAWNHWINHGKKEMRIYYSLLESGNKTVEDYHNKIPSNHWIKYIDNFYNGLDDFDWKTYVENYDDIYHLITKEDAWEHWIFCGKLEGRTTVNLDEMNENNKKILKIEMFSKTPPEYISDNSHTVISNATEYIVSSEEDEIVEYKIVEDKMMENETESSTKEEVNISEKPILEKKDIIRQRNILKESLQVRRMYEDKMKSFMKKYNITDRNSIYSDPKVEFRYFCFKYTDYIRNCCILPKVELYQSREAVFLEFREFPHVEFLIRNAIMKLGSKWSFTVICGNNNCKLMIDICKKISKNIKIIILQKEINSINDYSNLLKTIEFWNYIKGDKVLIYQEDSFIFSNNIEEFLEYDYIGAPWLEEVLPVNVGNGGFSLRTRKAMIDIIDAIDEEKHNNDEVISEDVFFSKHMQKLNMGKIADKDTALKFSTELIYNKDSFAGHQFWISDELWKNRIYDCLYKYTM